MKASHVIVLLAATLCACVSVQGGARAGQALRHGFSNSDEIAWAGHFAVVATPWPALQGGLEVEGRAEHERGSLFSAGLLAGVTTSCDTCVANFALHADTGVPLAWTTAGGFYAGTTLELPIRLESQMPTAERNRNFRLLATSPALVPFLRYRFYRLRDRGDHEQLHDLAVGTALRVMFATDIF